MRVIAGTAKRLRLKAPAGEHTRPTADRIKETLFNMLRPYLDDAVFLDLFAGSGGIGIEALSRGARHAYFAENDRQAISCIQENLKATHLEERATLLRADALAALSRISEKEVDLIFLDPPYDCGHEERLLAALAGKPWVTENTLLVVETSLRTDLSYIEALGFALEREKRYKTNRHLFCRKAAIE